MEELKSLKQYAKEAKQRLKSGFWDNYRKNLQNELEKAKDNGVAESKVKEYYKDRVSSDLKNKKESEEEFYIKVKNILDEEGEISGILGKLTDKEIYNQLSYEEKQRYNLELSEKYLKAVDRYNKEKALVINN